MRAKMSVRTAVNDVYLYVHLGELVALRRCLLLVHPVRLDPSLAWADFEFDRNFRIHPHLPALCVSLRL
jgi:hypothetical protein